jgi:hypothetical protein
MKIRQKEQIKQTSQTKHQQEQPNTHEFAECPLA